VPRDEAVTRTEAPEQPKLDRSIHQRPELFEKLSGQVRTPELQTFADCSITAHR
jgi:hypothetical protein